MVVPLLLTGCVEATSGGAPVTPRETVTSAPSLLPDGYSGLLYTQATVLQSAEHGPELCLGAVARSYPPQCGGLALPGWDWDALPTTSYERANGTTWGDYVVTGRLDGDAFVLQRKAVPSDGARDPVPGRPALDEDDLATTCAEPEGGWRPVDPRRATEAALQRALARADAAAGVGGVWLDQRLPAGTDLNDPGALVNDPQRMVLNVSTTGDRATLETSLRQVWGGALCVSAAAHSRAELQVVQGALTRRYEPLRIAVDEAAGRVEMTLPVAQASVQRELDAAYGSGVVRLSGALQPVPTTGPVPAFDASAAASAFRRSARRR